MAKNQSTSRPAFRVSFRTVLSLVTFALIIYVVYANFDDIKAAIGHLSETNIFVLLLLIPEQLFMYFCCGQMFFSYMRAKKTSKPVSAWTLMRVSLELNFVNHAVPAGGLGGLGYITWRLKPFGATPGQSSFMYVLRYVITICANQLQTIIAIIFLLLFNAVPASGYWVIWLTALLSIGIIAAIGFIIMIASSKSRIEWFVDHITRLINRLVNLITFGHKPSILERTTVDKYFTDAHDDLMTARENKKLLLRPIIWGIVYSFLEVATYWIVASSLGHPEILPQIMIGEAIGSVMGAIVPYGLYELGMAGIMVTLGVPIALAGTVVLMTRVIVLASTIISGYGFYQHSISKIGRNSQTKSNPSSKSDLSSESNSTSTPNPHSHSNPESSHDA